jgi:chromosome segregation ATPase
MRRNLAGLLALLALLLLLPVAGAHADDADMLAQLRSALRSTTAQLRELQDAQVAAQAKQSELEKQNEALRQQVDSLTKQVGEQGAEGKPKAAKAEVDRAALDQAVAEFNRRLASQNETLEKWKSAYTQAAGIARAKETERSQLAGKIDGLSKRAEDCEAKNQKLFAVGNEILDRYNNMDFGDVLGAREPFIGVKRVELQNLVQDYRGKLSDQKVTPDQTPAPDQKAPTQ